MNGELFQSSTEFLFPQRLIPELSDLRGEEWRKLIEKITKAELKSLERIGFELFVVRLNNCIPCHMDTYRSLHGCLRCARQTISHYRGDDQELMNLFEKACTDIELYIKKNNNFYWKIG
ncbi:MAG: hypothetical protein ABFD51_06455 [Anaerolineaceae bacterium]